MFNPTTSPTRRRSAGPISRQTGRRSRPGRSRAATRRRSDHAVPRLDRDGRGIATEVKKLVSLTESIRACRTPAKGGVQVGPAPAAEVHLRLGQLPLVRRRHREDQRPLPPLPRGWDARSRLGHPEAEADRRRGHLPQAEPDLGRPDRRTPPSTGAPRDARPGRLGRVRQARPVAGHRRVQRYRRPAPPPSRRCDPPAGLRRRPEGLRLRCRRRRRSFTPAQSR
jgi:hypothetical protein